MADGAQRWPDGQQPRIGAPTSYGEAKGQLMDYERLTADRAKIRLASELLVAIAQAGVPQPVAAASVLKRLAALTRDHLAHAEPIMRGAVAAETGGRHQRTAEAALAAFFDIREEWARYVYRWNPNAIADDWAGFVSATAVLVDDLDRRVTGKLAVLDALALHHGVVMSRAPVRCVAKPGP